MYVCIRFQTQSDERSYRKLKRKREGMRMLFFQKKKSRKFLSLFVFLIKKTTTSLSILVRQPIQISQVNRNCNSSARLYVSSFSLFIYMSFYLNTHKLKINTAYDNKCIKQKKRERSKPIIQA